MLESRRELLLGLVGAAGLISSAGFLTAGGAQYPPPRPTPPTGDPGTLSGAPKHIAPRVLTAKDQELLRTDLDQLYRLVSELLKEYQSADPNTVLSVSFVKNAEQAEKLAKQVKNLARG
ncbi:MAG TPA: hypothetical protein VGF61_19920 [Candidatus Acidoferrum sp.]|jgi:hypothetical protein